MRTVVRTVASHNQPGFGGLAWRSEPGSYARFVDMVWHASSG
ncbi:MAG: hypothetical protein ACR2JK_15505 [Geodermatophilaceae bacterium]